MIESFDLETILPFDNLVRSLSAKADRYDPDGLCMRIASGKAGLLLQSVNGLGMQHLRLQRRTCPKFLGSLKNAAFLRGRV
jgi:hypothetical protein